MIPVGAIVRCRESVRKLGTEVDGKLRSLAFCLLESSDLEKKIRVGTFMGLLARLGRELDQRHAELLDRHSDGIAIEKCTGTMLLNLVKKHLEHEETAVADAPTFELMHELEYLLENRRWSDLVQLDGPHTLSWDVGSGLPPRPAGWSYSQEKIFSIRTNQDLVEDEEQWRRFLHYVLVDVEVSAMEVCALMMVQNPRMPRAFRYDMARQIWDEARHAVLVEALLREAGAAPGDYSYSALVVKRFQAIPHLSEQLASQQVIQEGNALEMNCDLIATLRRGGKVHAAEAFEFVNADECEHVRIGNRWLRFLTDDGEGYLGAMERASRAIQIPAEGKGAWNPGLRRWAGAPESFVLRMSQKVRTVGRRGYPKGSATIP